MRVVPAGAAGPVDFGPHALHSLAGLAVGRFGGEALTELEGVVVVRAVVAVVVNYLIAHFRAGQRIWIRFEYP